MTIEILQTENQPVITVAYMVELLNKRFKNKDQFTSQLDTICLDIAEHLTKGFQKWLCIPELSHGDQRRVVFSRKGENIHFDCSQF